MKKILLFATDPGGANTLVPLVSPLRKKGYKLVIYGKDAALDKYRLNKITATDIMKVIKRVEPEEILKFLKKEKPDFILTGTSANDMAKKYIWKLSGELQIPSFAILDQWMNYGIRFSRYGVSEIEKYNKNPDHEYMPTKILVMDNLAKKEMIKDGIPKNRILISGQPFFEFLRNKVFKRADLDIINKKFDIKNNDFIIVYASEAILKTYQENINSKNYMGYNEISTFICLYEDLLQIPNLKNIKLIIKLHPKEDLTSYSKVLTRIPKSDKIIIFTDKESNTWDLIKSADLVCGMSSMFLLESFVLGKSILSIQIGLNHKNPFVLDRLGISRSITKRTDLSPKLKEIMNEGHKKQMNFKLIPNPIERVINYMEDYLCQN